MLNTILDRIPIRTIIYTIIYGYIVFLGIYLLCWGAPQIWFRFTAYLRQVDILPDQYKATSTKYNDLFDLSSGFGDDSRFIYSPLPHGPYTRLIRLLPGKDATPIQCSIFDSDLSENPKYEALSYEWGSDDFNMCGIMLDGKPFPVRTNLWQALHYLRDKRTTRTLWIDAICINQHDDLEKAVQIAQMKDIYSQAWTVLSWLGTSNKYIDEAFDMMEGLYREIPSSILYGSPISFPLPDVPAAEDLMMKCQHFITVATARLRANPLSPETIRSIFSKCPYWSRLWIIQEVLLAKKLVICCGNRRFRWEVYSALRPLMHHYLVMHNYALSPERRDLENISVAFDTNSAAFLDKQRVRAVIDSTGQPSFDLKGVLNISLAAACSRPRDRIYGLLGLIHAPEMPIDSEKPMFEVFTDSIHYIKHPRIRGEGDQYDLHTVRFGQIIQALLLGPFDNTRRMNSCFRISGFHTGTITQIGPTCTRSDPFDVIKTKLEHLFQSFPEALRGIPLTTDDTKVLESIVSRYAHNDAKTYNLPRPTEVSPIVIKTKSVYESKCMDMIQPWRPRTFKAVQPTYSKDGMLDDYAKQENPALELDANAMLPPTSQPTPPRIFRTSALGFGLCPASTLPGDIVIQFLYSDTAFILRPLQQHPPSQRMQYSFVGRCFVGRNRAIDATLKFELARDIFYVALHGDILTEEMARRVPMDRLDIIVDSETLQYLTQPRSHP